MLVTEKDTSWQRRARGVGAKSEPLSAVAIGVSPSPEKNLSASELGEKRFWNRPLTVLPCLQLDPETALGEKRSHSCWRKHADGALRGGSEVARDLGKAMQGSQCPGRMQWEGVPESVCDLVNGNRVIFSLSVFHYGGKVCHYSGQLCALYKSCRACTCTHPYMQHT